MMAIAPLQYAWTLFALSLTKSMDAKVPAVQIASTPFILAETCLVPSEGYLVDRLGARRVVPRSASGPSDGVASSVRLGSDWRTSTRRT